MMLFCNHYWKMTIPRIPSWPYRWNLLHSLSKEGWSVPSSFCKSLDSKLDKLAAEHVPKTERSTEIVRDGISFVRLWNGPFFPKNDCEAVLWSLFGITRGGAKIELVVGVEMLVYTQDKSRWTTSYIFLQLRYVQVHFFFSLLTHFCVVVRVVCLLSVVSRRTGAWKGSYWKDKESSDSSSIEARSITQGAFEWYDRTKRQCCCWHLQKKKLSISLSARKTSAITYASCRDREVSLAVRIQNVLLYRHPPL